MIGRPPASTAGNVIVPGDRPEQEAPRAQPQQEAPQDQPKQEAPKDQQPKKDGASVGVILNALGVRSTAFSGI